MVKSKTDKEGLENLGETPVLVYWTILHSSKIMERIGLKGRKAIRSKNA